MLPNIFRLSVVKKLSPAIYGGRPIEVVSGVVPRASKSSVGSPDSKTRSTGCELGVGRSGVPALFTTISAFTSSLIPGSRFRIESCFFSAMGATSMLSLRQFEGSICRLRLTA